MNKPLLSEKTKKFAVGTFYIVLGVTIYIVPNAVYKKYYS